MANRFLSNIRINDAYTLPASDGSSGQVITTDGSGNLSFVDPTSGAATTALSLNVTVKNVSGGSLAKGTIVHAQPSANPPSGNVVEVVAADYDTSASMPAIGVLNETLANEAEGQAIMFGAVSGIDTSSFSAGDELWVGNNGAFTNTKPATAGQLIQKIAVVIKSHATAGLIKVFGAGRTNDVPLPLYIDNTNQRVGIGISTPAVPLHVNGWARLNGSLQLDGNNRQVMAIDNTSLLFGTDNTVRMTITNVGKVGIALTSPESKLDVFESSTNQKAFKATDGTSWVSFVPTLGSGGYNGISSAGDIGLIFSIDNDNTTNSTTNGLVIAPHAQATSGLKILENGYVGIGDSTPLYNLHVESTDDTLALFKSTDNKASIRVADDDTSAYVSAENGRASFGHYIGANNSNLNINSSGNVSIGTTSANGKLNVAGDVNVSGALKGPSTFYIDPSPDDTGEPGGATTDTGTVVILGDLQVTGTTTTIDSTTLNVGDKNIVLAKDATTAAAANGAGITINGANATITYDSTNDRFNFNKAIASSTHVTSGANVYSGTSGQFRNYAGVWTATTGVSGNGFSFISADGTAMTISSVGDVVTYGALTVNGGVGNAVINVNGSGDSFVEKDNGNHLYFANNSQDKNIYLRVNDGGTYTNAIQIIGSTANVGIGTNTPGLKLTVNGAMSAHLFYDYNDTSYFVNPNSTGTSANFAGKVQASQVGVTNIVTNKVVKFNGSILDDSIITDDGTFIDVGGKVQADNAFIVQGIDTSNSLPSADHAVLSGYGLIGNRGTFYITNPYTVQIGTGVSHNNDPAALFTSSSITLKKETTVENFLTISRGADKKIRFSDTRTGANTFSIEHDASQIYLYNETTASSLLEIENNGNIGVGLSPIYKFDVNGTLGVRNGTIQTNGSTTSFNFLAGGTAKGAKVAFLLASSSYSATPSTGQIWATDSMQSPIYYDYNNTSYYVNPNADSSFGGSLGLVGDLDLALGSYITFYGNGSGDHGITSRNHLGNATDDLRINSYGAVYINLDSNNNNTSTASFEIGRHGSTGTISDWLFKVDGETGATDISGDVTINPSTNYALYIGRMPGQPNIKSSDAYAFMDSNGGWAGLNWYSSDNVALANGGGSVSIGNSGASQKLTVWGSVGATIYYDKDNTAYYVNPNGNSILNTISAFGLSVNTLAVSANATVGGTLDVNGTVEHGGLVMTSGTNVDQIYEASMSFTLTADTWTDTGINSTDLATGTYVVQVFVDDHNAGGGHYDEYYSGTMSWFASNTNSTNVDEIVLHNAGHASNSSYIQLRTQRHPSGGDDLMLQVKQNFTHTTALDGTNGKRMTFKFRRLI